MVEEKLKQVMADVFQIEPNEVGPGASIENVPQWDSMSSLLLATSIEEEFEIQLTNEELMSLSSYDLILGALKERGL